MTDQHQFGGEWTTKKLERVEKYLNAYMKIMNKQRFRVAYIDAFAGTGYRTANKKSNLDELPFREFAEQESIDFIDGSARVALRVEPRFHRYIFIEQKMSHYTELKKL